MRNRLAYTIVRVLLGLAFLFFGVTKFLPMDGATLPGPAMDFLTAVASTGYMIPLIGVLEILVGLLLLANFWVPFAMVVLSPIIVNVALFSLFLAPSLIGTVIIFVLIALQVYVMYYTWKYYLPLFSRVK